MVPQPCSPKTRAPREIAAFKSKSHRYLRERNLTRQSTRNAKRRGGFMMISMKAIRRFRRGATGGGNEAETDVIEEYE